MQTLGRKIAVSLFFSLFAACAAQDEPDETLQGSAEDEVAQNEQAAEVTQALFGYCARPASGTNSSYSLSNGLRTGSVASYYCFTGYVMSGTRTRTCQSSGTWSGALPTCTPLSCGALANPANGMVTMSGTTYGSSARYTCAAGYSLSGNATRYCQATGWSGVTPVCIR